MRLLTGQEYNELLEAGNVFDIVIESGSIGAIGTLDGQVIFNETISASRTLGNFAHDTQFKIFSLGGIALIDEEKTVNEIATFNENQALVGHDGQTYSLTATYTFAEFQTAVANGYVGTAFISDIGNGSMWVSDGVRGRPMNGEVILYNSQAVVNLVTTTPRAVGIAIPLPIGLFKDNDVLEISIDESKSGTVDASTTQLQIGTSQVTVGTQIGNVSMPMTSGGNRRAFGTYRIKRNSATSVTVLNGPNGQDGVAASSDLATTTSTVSTLDSGTNYLQLTNAMSSGGSDVVSVNKFIVKLITG